MRYNQRLLATTSFALAPLLIFVVSVLAAACSSDDGADLEKFAVPTKAGLESGYPRYVDTQNGLTIILGTPDLAVGRQRIAFVLRDAEGIVRVPLATIVSRFGNAESSEETANAHFYDFPDGIRGIYISELTFDRAGTWSLAVDIARPNGTSSSTSFRVEVTEHSRAPAVGDPAPASNNRTLATADSVYQLSTGAEPDPELYKLTIARALAQKQPLVVVFASPGFCTTALCGPQVEVLSKLRQRHVNDANFIHVDLYENPIEIRKAGLEVAIETPLLEEWGLETDEWTFVIDTNGRVIARFEAFTPISELEQALLFTLQNP